ncbi:sulfotransferase family 2 domain-containing protein [Rhodocyclaceae bacterium SMB388]
MRRHRCDLWVLEDLGLGYLPVPKVASSSIRNSFVDRMTPVLLGRPDVSRRAVKERVEARIRLSLDITGVKERRKTLFVFTFVRNPLTRLHSCYRDKVVNAAERREKCTLSPYGIQFGMSFDEFAMRIAEIPDARADQHFRSQHSFVASGGALLVDYVGKIEQFEEDWLPLKVRFGLPPPARSRRVSGEPLAVPDLPLSRAAAEQAVRRYAEDIEIFGYEREIEAVLALLK